MFLTCQFCKVSCSDLCTDPLSIILVSTRKSCFFRHLALTSSDWQIVFFQDILGHTEQLHYLWQEVDVEGNERWGNTDFPLSSMCYDQRGVKWVVSCFSQWLDLLPLCVGVRQDVYMHVYVVGSAPLEIHESFFSSCLLCIFGKIFFSELVAKNWCMHRANKAKTRELNWGTQIWFAGVYSASGERGLEM